VITDNTLCPVIPFAHLSLVVPSRSIPLIGYPTTISCIINYLVLEMVNRQHPQLKRASGAAGADVSGKRYPVQHAYHD
jgi:DNA-binding MurR/RpiR family transcriptional regulator